MYTVRIIAHFYDGVSDYRSDFIDLTFQIILATALKQSNEIST